MAQNINQKYYNKTQLDDGIHPAYWDPGLTINRGV